MEWFCLNIDDLTITSGSTSIMCEQGKPVIATGELESRPVELGQLEFDDEIWNEDRSRPTGMLAPSQVVRTNGGYVVVYRVGPQLRYASLFGLLGWLKNTRLL